MSDTLISFGDLKASAAHEFNIELDAAARADVAKRLGILGVKKARLSGRVTPVGKMDWALKAELGATVVQSCVVSLEPVTTRVEDTVLRSYLANPPELTDAAEVEMPEDDTVEPLPVTLDLQDVLSEALSLVLPTYPRAPDVDFSDAQFSAPGTTPLTDEDVRPFAGLKSLRDKLKDND